MRVEDHFTREACTIHVDAALPDAARRMRACGFGSLVVVGDDGRVVGMLTDRDLALRVVAVQDSGARTVEHVMSAPAVVVAPDTPVDDALQIMRTRGMRRLPIVDDGKPLGVLSLDDVLGLYSTCMHDLTVELRSQRDHEHHRGRLEAAREALERIYEDVRDRLRYTAWYSRERLFDEIDDLKDRAQKALEHLDGG
jgi:signal-transduction protein with cAMP-binding, CBS, and nucleotidyltransferase domain